MATPRTTTAPTATWLRWQAVVWLAVLTAIGCRPPLASGVSAPVIAATMLGSYAVLLARLRSGRTLADGVTIARGLGIAALVAFAARPLGAVAWLAAAAVVAADLLDGALARRRGPSVHGAELDMETDQLVVLGLAVLVVAGGGGVHVLLLPALRYAFVLAAWCTNVPAHEPKPVHGDNRRGRRVCAAVLVALLVAAWAGTPRGLADAVVAAAVALLAWSFAGDAKFLLAHRQRRHA
jgi:phosphatidylglycerophosphate synthase